MRFTLLFFLLLIITSCSKDDSIDTDNNSQSELYFPSNNLNTWDTIDAETLNWNKSALEELNTFLEDTNTRAFLILKDGKIVIEKYFGKNITNTATFNQSSTWYWASAGKTLTASLVGIAQRDKLLNINNKTSDYLGSGWTSLASDKEQLIIIKNHLTLTTGFDYRVSDLDCYTPSCFKYKTDAGEQWFYHNGSYTILKSVIEKVSGLSYNSFTKSKLENHIGINGNWVEGNNINLYWSTGRDAARFGLFLLNKGNWNGTQILSEDYFNEMTNSSQTLNPSYGYLTWLNGKSSIVYPGLPTSFNQQLSVNAPLNNFTAMGKNGQIIDIVPSKNMVVIRLGDNPSTSLIPVNYYNNLWEKINAVID